MLFIDGDIGVVNPYRLIEEFIDDRVNIIFYDRLFNWEVATGSYLIRNSQYSIEFLSGFANVAVLPNNPLYGSDNGAIHVSVETRLIQPKIYRIAAEKKDQSTSAWNRRLIDEITETIVQTSTLQNHMPYHLLLTPLHK
jgi:hypothetical protein